MSQTVVVLSQAAEDIEFVIDFYEQIESRVGDYFRDFDPFGYPEARSVFWAARDPVRVQSRGVRTVPFRDLLSRKGNPSSGSRCSRHAP